MWNSTSLGTIAEGNITYLPYTCHQLIRKYLTSFEQHICHVWAENQKLSYHVGAKICMRI